MVWGFWGSRVWGLRALGFSKGLRDLGPRDVCQGLGMLAGCWDLDLGALGVISVFSASLRGCDFRSYS